MANIVYNGETIPVITVDYNILIGLEEALIASGITIPNMPEDNIVAIEGKEYITFDGLIQLFSILGTASSASLLFHCYSYIASIANQSDADKADYLLEFTLGRRQAKFPS